MADLTLHETQTLLAALQEIHACRDVESFGQVVIEEVTRVVRSDRADLQLYREPPESIETLHRNHPLPGDEERDAIFETCMIEHPIVEHVLRTGDSGPHLLTDFTSIHDWRQTELYSLCVREPRDDFMLCDSMTIAPNVELSISLNRRRADFDEHDRMMLGLAGGHIAQAWRNVRHTAGLDEQIELLERGLEPRCVGIMMVDPDDHIRAASRRAVALLDQYFPDWPGFRLPETLGQWLDEQHRRWGNDEGNLTRPPRPFRVAGEQGSLMIHIKPGEEDSGIVLQLREIAPHADARRLERLGLTPRQAQTLYWLTRGKSNPEIAAILGVRPRTVAKFVETLFTRLNVDNRLAAALCAQEALGESG